MELRDESFLFCIDHRCQQSSPAYAGDRLTIMAKKVADALKVITANDLLSGAVVYLDSKNQWNRDINAARIFEDTECASGRISLRGGTEGNVIGMDIIGISVSRENCIEPVLIRERLRLHGPSVDYGSHKNTGQ